MSPFIYGLIAVGLSVAGVQADNWIVQLAMLATGVLASIRFLRSLSRPPEMHGFGSSESVSRPKPRPVEIGLPDAPEPQHMDPEAVLASADPNRKIEAIKAYRKATGAGLKEAKDTVEAYFARTQSGNRNGPWG